MVAEKREDRQDTLWSGRGELVHPRESGPRSHQMQVFREISPKQAGLVELIRRLPPDIGIARSDTFLLLADYAHAQPTDRNTWHVTTSWAQRLQTDVHFTPPMPLGKVMPVDMRADPHGDLAAMFDTLVDQWSIDSRFMSSIQQIALHPAYQRIIGMGPKVLPFIFQDLPKRGVLWFWALNAITGEDPVQEAESDGGDKAVAAWLKWGHEHGYIG